MKYLRLFFKILLGLVIAIGLFLAVSLAPVDETPYQQTAYYAQTRQRLNQLPAPPKPQTELRAGWAKVNLTPSFTTSTGGYGVRRGKHWTTVRDSIYVRTFVLDNGSTRAAVVALDLLITPPTVVEQLKKRLPEVGLRWEHVFIGAIHSHNTMGGWAPKLVGGLIAGDYEPRIIDLITDAILKSIRLAQQQTGPVEVGFTQVDATDFISNRLNQDGPVDGPIRLLKFRKKNGDSALLCTFSGHATLTNIHAYQYLTRDYPGALVDQLEQKTGSFVAFMAGAVGSTAPKAESEKDDPTTINRYADSLTARTLPALAQIQLRPDSSLAVLTLPLGLREPHARVIGNWRVRPWLFYALYGDYPSDLKALRIGRTILVGTPCDFSGELVADFNQIVAQEKINLMVTSFDGGYVGYITPDKYYHKDAYETQVMNWFGPYNGTYFVEMMKGLIERVSGSGH